MELFVNIVCAVLGIAGTYGVMKIQERGQMKMKVQMELVNDMREIEKRMTEDFATAVPKKPYHGYGFSFHSSPSDFGLNEKLEAVLGALH